MAINNVTTNTRPEKGITYSAITDSSVDWTGITNSTYFYDKDTDLPYYKNSGGTVVSLFEEGGGSSDTFVTGGTYSGSTIILNRNDGNSVNVTGITSDSIYTANGTLTGNRTVDLDGNSLTFNATGLFKISNGTKSVYPGWNTHSSFNIDGGSRVWSLYSANASSTFNANEFGIGVGSSIPFRIFNDTSIALGGVIKSNLDTNYNIQTNGNTLIGGNLDAKSNTNFLSFDFANYPKMKIGTSTSQWWFVNSNAGNSSTFADNDLYLWDSTNSRKVVRFNANGSTELLNKVELSTTTDGFLMPRLTTAQKNAISSPDTNLMVFDTDLSSLQRYNGTAWVDVAAGVGIVQLTQEGGSGGSVFYTDIQSALTAANISGGDITITLHDNIIVTAPINTQTKTNIDNITIDLNGFTISNTSNDASQIFFIYFYNNNRVKIINGSIIKTTGTGSAIEFVAGLGYFSISNCYVYSEAGSALKISASVSGVDIWDLGNTTFKTNTGYGVFLADELGGISLTNFISISTSSGMACFLNAGGDVTNFKAIAEGTGAALRVRSAVTSVTNFYAESNSGNCVLLESLVPIVKDFTAISVSGYAVHSLSSPYKIENFYCKTTSGTHTLYVPSTSILLNGDIFSDSTDCAFISNAERVENVSFTTNSGANNVVSRFTTNWINCTFRNKDGVAFYNYSSSTSKFKKCTFISEKTSGGTAHAANILDGASVITFVNCDFEVADSTVNCIKGNVAMNMKVASCSFDGSATPINSNITLNYLETDAYGNVTT